MQHTEYTAHECSEKSYQKEEKQTMLFSPFKVTLCIFHSIIQHPIAVGFVRVLGNFKEFSSASRGEN